MSRSYMSSPPSASMVCSRTALLFNVGTLEQKNEAKHGCYMYTHKLDCLFSKEGNIYVVSLSVLS
jgi:hypothetical protein